MASPDDRNEVVLRSLGESALLKLKIRDDAGAVEIIVRMAETMAACLEKGGTIYVMGNGGSAADAQHIAGELVGRFKKERHAFACVALSTDTSVLTSVGNDYGFNEIFMRQVEGLVRQGDVVLGLSTSGKSRNVIDALELARERGATVLALSGGGGGELPRIADHCLTVPGTDTPRVQECHITVAHILCELVEDRLCRKAE